MGTRGGDPVGIGALRPREAALERPGHTLDAAELALGLAGERLALALDAEHVLFHLDLDLGQVHARHIGQDQEAAFLFTNVDARRPGAGVGAGRHGDIAAEEMLEYMADVAAEHRRTAKRNLTKLVHLFDSQEVFGPEAVWEQTYDRASAIQEGHASGCPLFRLWGHQLHSGFSHERQSP